MDHFVVVSPDKISLGSFVKFVRKMVGTEYVLGEMHNLMSTEAIDLYLTDISGKHPKWLIPFYGKGMKESSIPARLLQVAHVVVWFDLYSTVPKILKVPDKRDVLDKIIEEWVKYITAIS